MGLFPSSDQHGRFPSRVLSENVTNNLLQATIPTYEAVITVDALPYVHRCTDERRGIICIDKHT
jgi:hypothetical protein